VILGLFRIAGGHMGPPLRAAETQGLPYGFRSESRAVTQGRPYGFYVRDRGRARRIAGGHIGPPLRAAETQGLPYGFRSNRGRPRRAALTGSCS